LNRAPARFFYTRKTTPTRIGRYTAALKLSATHRY